MHAERTLTFFRHPTSSSVFSWLNHWEHQPAAGLFISLFQRKQVESSVRHRAAHTRETPTKSSPCLKLEPFNNSSKIGNSSHKIPHNQIAVRAYLRQTVKQRFRSISNTIHWTLRWNRALRWLFFGLLFSLLYLSWSSVFLNMINSFFI